MISRLPLCLSLIVALCVLPACSSSEGDGPTTPETISPQSERVAMLMGGWPHAKAIAQTGKATAFRITQDRDQNFKEVKIGDGIELTDVQREALVRLLVRDDSYEWEMAKGCEPMPGVLVTFEDGATYARVRFCFSCQMVGFRPGSWEDFDPINDPLVRWVKGVFPEDELIQKLGTPEEEHGL